MSAIRDEPGREANRREAEKFEKEAEEGKDLFHFTVRTETADGVPSRLEVHARIYQIEWSHGNGWVRLVIGDSAERGKGYGREALRLLIHFAFGELNLYRLSAAVPEYNPAALHLFHKAGFVQEMRRRQALNRDGRTWDMFHLGLLQAK